MKQVGQPFPYTGTNAWGADSESHRTNFEVEAADIGVTRPHYLGFNYRRYTFTKTDVGRRIQVIRHVQDPIYICWVFI